METGPFFRYKVDEEMTDMTISNPESVPADILSRLEAAGADGLKKTALLGKGKKAQVPRLAAVELLVARREVVKLGTEKSPVFVLRRFYNPLELAYAAIEAKAVPGTAKLYTDKELGAGLAKHVKEKLADAVRLLLGERKLVRVQRAKSVYYLHAAAILPLVVNNPSEPASTGSAALDDEEVSLEQVWRAYESVVRESGYSDVLIVDLQRACAIPLEKLQPFLVAQSRGRTRRALARRLVARRFARPRGGD